MLWSTFPRRLQAMRKNDTENNERPDPQMRLEPTDAPLLDMRSLVDLADVAENEADVVCAQSEFNDGESPRPVTVDLVMKMASELRSIVLSRL